MFGVRLRMKPNSYAERGRFVAVVQGQCHTLISQHRRQAATATRLSTDRDQQRSCSGQVLQVCNDTACNVTSSHVAPPTTKFRWPHGDCNVMGHMRYRTTLPTHRTASEQGSQTPARVSAYLWHTPPAKTCRQQQNMPAPASARTARPQYSCCAVLSSHLAACTNVPWINGEQILEGTSCGG
jgi:hypothetical protein